MFLTIQTFFLELQETNSELWVLQFQVYIAQFCKIYLQIMTFFSYNYNYNWDFSEVVFFSEFTYSRNLLAFFCLNSDFTVFFFNQLS